MKRLVLPTTGVTTTVAAAAITTLAVAAMIVFPLTTAHSQTQTQAQTEKTGTMTKTEISKETAADEARSFSDYQAVVEALQPYIESAKSGDGKQTRTAFFDHAHIVGSVNGAFSNSDLDSFAADLSSIGPSPDVKHHIAWIDISGPAAAAKVEFINWAGFRFTDFFVLYKHDGQWKISGKVYDSHANN
ncbi:nuclear transport factor 2 family protein [Denitrobaculum tricleocarpae]|nr:nuclear transport factor 2 family protein [Denitrobaculum tricleocarpae]